jgi:hypothetical protein
MRLATRNEEVERIDLSVLIYVLLGGGGGWFQNDCIYIYMLCKDTNSKL